MARTLTYGIIEDSLKVCDGIKERMEDYPEWKCCGYLHHKTEAIQAIKENMPQLIFLDWALKGGSAYEVLTEIVNIHSYNPYIIFNTGYQSENPEIPQEIINNFKIDKYLVKPLWENLRLHLDEYLREAELKCSHPPAKQSEIWLMDVSRKKERINVENIVCVLQDFQNPYHKVFIVNNRSIMVKISWTAVTRLLDKHEVNYFITNNREHVVVRKFIQKYKRPYLQLVHLKQKVEVVKNKLCAFEKWLVE